MNNNLNSNENRKKSVTLTLTESCNLDCSYCYENHKSTKKMSFEMAKGILDYELNLNDGFDEVTIDFFGGEPFLEFDMMRKISEYLWDNKFNKQFILFSSTNGTLIHGEIQNWLSNNKNKIWIGLSADGTEEMHNLNRDNSFSLIDFDFFSKTWPMQGVKMTISKETLPHLASGVRYLEDKGFIVNCNLAYGLDWSSEVLIQQLANELNKLIDYYCINTNVRPCSILNMEINYLAYDLGFNKWCGAGTQMKVYSPEGNQYPCHYFEPVSIGAELAAKAALMDFTKDNELMDKSCTACVLLPICPTCYGSNYASTGDVSLKDKNICKLTKLIALANSYLHYRKLTNYSNEELNITEIQRKELTDAIVNIQNAFSTEFNMLI